MLTGEALGAALRWRSGGPQARRAGSQAALGRTRTVGLDRSVNNGARDDRIRVGADSLPRVRDQAEHGQRRDDRVALIRVDVLRGAVRDVLHDSVGEHRGLAPDRRAPPGAPQFGPGTAEHDHPRALQRHLPARGLRRGARGRAQAAAVVRVLVDHGRDLRQRPGLRVLRGERVLDLQPPLRSVYYLTTGFHGLHVAGGLLAFIVVLLRSTYGRFTPADATSAIVVSYYWHFVDVVWIGLFTTIYLIR